MRLCSLVLVTMLSRVNSGPKMIRDENACHAFCLSSRADDPLREMAHALDKGPGTSLRDHDDYISVTMEFRCNLRCVHCMIEDTMDWLHPAPADAFAGVLEDQRLQRRWKGLILTGSEITLNRELPHLARRARDAGFERVRIQTHGMQLAREDFARRLLDAGVNEFFVSVAGASRASHDRITQVPGAWDKMMAGMAFLDQEPDVRLFTNTVVTQLCYQELPDLVSALEHLDRLVQMEFWNFFPMAEADEKRLAVRFPDLLPPLFEAIERARARGRHVEVKNVPECLMGPHRAALVNVQPLLVIDPGFWTEFDRNGFYQCPHRSRCTATECLGLTTAYIARFGDERGLLSPFAERCKA